MIGNIIKNTIFASNNVQIAVFFSIFALIFYSVRGFLNAFSKRFRALEKPIKNCISSRIISTLHANIVAAFSLLILYYDDKIYTNRLIYNTHEISFTLNIVIGYMLFDFFLMAKYKEIFDWPFVLHHGVSVIAFIACSQAHVFPFIAICRLTSETSTFFINSRWFLLTFKMKESKLYIYNAFCILIFFGLFRILPIIPIWASFYDSVISDPNWNKIHIGYKIICVFSSSPLDVLNIFWYYRIIMIGKKQIKQLKIDKKEQ